MTTTTNLEVSRRRSTLRWLAVSTVVLAFVYLSLDGYHNAISISFRGSGEFFAEPPAINWMHGWPCAFLVRPSIYSLEAGRGVANPTSFRGGMGFYSRWPFDEAPTSVFHITPLIVDAAVFMALLSGVWVGVGRLSSRLNLQLRFGLRMLFLMTLIVAVVMAFNLHSFLPRHVCQFAALAVMLAAAILTLYATIGSVQKLRYRQATHRAIST